MSVHLSSCQVQDDTRPVTKQANILIAPLIINTASMAKKGIQSGKTYQSNFIYVQKMQVGFRERKQSF